MTEHYDCPRCQADLPFGLLSDECPKCKLSFHNSPHIRPVGHGVDFKNEEVLKPHLAKAAFLSAFKRILFTVGVVIALVALLVITALPFGGGGKLLIILLWAAIVIGPLWVLKPLLKLLAKKIKSNSKTN